MRYALNLANGFGLTWNLGEYDGGFTYSSWTLLIAYVIGILGKYNAPVCFESPKKIIEQ